MNFRKLLISCTAAGGMLMLILDSKTALSGAAEGIGLCLKTVVPSLFPFLFLSSILTGSLWGVNYAPFRFLAEKIGIPNGAESILIVSLLGGYPAGAQIVSRAYQDSLLTKQDAEHLLMFCSNAGPAFLFGITAIHFPSLKQVWILWLIQIISSLLTGYLYANGSQNKVFLPDQTINFTAILIQTVKTMGILCGWILLFRILTVFLERWILWIFPIEIQVFIAGFLEISNGCCMLSNISSMNLRFVFCTLFLTLGGLCVTLQTVSVIGSLPLKPYIHGKIVQTVIGFFLGLLYLAAGVTIFGIVAFVLLLSFGLVKKRSSISIVSGV